MAIMSLFSCNLMFINKLPLRAPHVLDSYNFLPLNVLHDIEQYPIYYDIIYYPALYILTSESCVSWLQDDLNSHPNLCHVCCSAAPGVNIRVSNGIYAGFVAQNPQFTKS